MRTEQRPPSAEALEAADAFMDSPPFSISWRSDDVQMTLAHALDRFADRACEQRVAAMVQEFLDCAKYDALMEGPLFRTWDRSALDRLRKKYEAMLEGWVATAFSAPQ